MWDPISEGFISLLESPLPMPGVKEKPEFLISYETNRICINYDIFGLCYWMLNRLEELDRVNLDEHERYQYKSSHAYKYNYIQRPVVDEWLCILGQIFKKCYPKLIIENPRFQIIISHDVDEISRYRFLPTTLFCKRIIVDLFRGKLRNVYVGIVSSIFKNRMISRNDPYNSFDYFMSQSIKYNLKSTFFFMTGEHKSHFDGFYNLENKSVKGIILDIITKGHHIGLHPSYTSFINFDQLEKEHQNILKFCKDHGVALNSLPVRMHYLRWSHPETMNYLDRLGLTYDSTLGYPEMIGFRCGTCFQYTPFDPINLKTLNIKLRPLIVMDVTLLNYMQLPHDKALEKLLELKSICKKFGGQFTLLWHNSQIDKKSLMLYEAALSN